MKKLSEKLFGSIFVVIVIVAVISGSFAFFRPNISISSAGTPTGFALTAQPSISAGADRVVQVNSNVQLASVPSGRITYYSWEIKSPGGKTEKKFGRSVSFKPTETGSYVATILANPGNLRDTATITSLPQKDFQLYQGKLKVLQTEERTAKRPATTTNKRPVANILLVYPNPATEGGAIRFLAYAYDPDTGGSIRTYEWRAGSRILSTKSSFLATKIVPGTYTFFLTVTDDKGAKSLIATQRVVVKPVNARTITPLTGDGIAFWEVD